MKKCLLLLIISLLCNYHVNAVILTGNCGDNATFIIDDDWSLYISGTGEMVDCTNSRPWSYPVYSNIKRICIDSGITSIGNNAFSFCTELVSVELPTSLTNIGDNAFYNCTSLKNIDLPSSLESIGSSSFSCCTDLESIVIPDNVTFLGSAAFSGCNKLASKIIIPNGVRVIPSGIFQLCKNIPSVILGDNVETIEDKAFYWCTSLKTVSFGNKLMSIGEEAFNDCRMTSLVFADGLQSIGKNAFVNCGELVSLKLPSTLQSIEEYAFRNCSKLETVDFGSGIKSIGAHAFCGCNSMTSLKLPDSLTFIGESAFAGSDYGTGNHTFTTVQIGNGLKEISNAFWGMNHNQPKIESFVIGNSVTSIHDYTPIFGSNYSDTWGTPVSYLLTNNKVDLYSNGISGVHGPNCTIYVADVSKYSDNEVRTYGIKNLVTTTTYTGEYSGVAPELNFTSQLSGYTVAICGDYYAAGTYTSLEVDFSKDDFSSTITVPCNYTITKAPLTIIPYDITITYNEEIPEFECFYQGLKNNETPEYALSILPSFTTNAKKGSNAGEYQIYASGAEAKNYSLSYQTGTLTIKPAKQSIVWEQSFDGIVSDSKVELTAVSSSGLTIQYTSSDPSIAYIAVEGDKTYLYACKDGVVNITASQVGNNNYEAAPSISKTIEILPKAATGISLDCNNIEIIVGQTASLSATVSPETTPDKSVIWSSNNTSIASVDQNGLVTANNVGEATITATTTDGSNLSASCKVTVTPILATSITLDKTTAEINVGGSTSLSATILPETATYKTVTWSSSNESVATVTDGIVIGNAPGTAIISASTTDGSNLTATCTVTVLDVLATMISLDKEALDLYIDEATTLTVAVYPDNTTNKAVTWTSSNASVATVADGVVTAKSEGTATITAKTTDGSNLSATCQITVKRHPQTIIWNQDLSTVVSGGELIKLEATASSGLDITFSSSDENIASIFMFSDGAYLNAYGEGNVNITASQAGNNYYAPASIVKTVNVVASSSIKDVTSEGLFTIYTLNGFKVGIFTAEEYKKLRLTKGIYVVNGKKKTISE